MSNVHYHEALLGLTAKIMSMTYVDESTENKLRNKLISTENISENTFESFLEKWKYTALEDIFKEAISVLNELKYEMKVRACAWMWYTAVEVSQKEDNWIDRALEELNVSIKDMNNDYHLLCNAKKIEYEEEINIDDEERKQKPATERNEIEEEESSTIGSNAFKSSVTRGGNAIFPEHIYVDDKEVSWEKKTGVFGKDSKSIPIKNVTEIEIHTSLLGCKIKIHSRGFGFIEGENFTKSDVKEIKSLIEKAQLNY